MLGDKIDPINRTELNEILDKVCENEVIRKQISEYIDNMGNISFEEDMFTSEELMLLRMAFNILNTIVESMREGNSDVYMSNTLYDLKNKLGIYDIVN